MLIKGIEWRLISRPKNLVWSENKPENPLYGKSFEYQAFEQPGSQCLSVNEIEYCMAFAMGKNSKIQQTINSRKNH